MASELLRTWLEHHRTNIYSNERGAVMIVNFPIELENELFKNPYVGNLLDADTLENGVILPVEQLPITLTTGRSKLTQRDKAEIRAQAAEGIHIGALADMYHVHRRTISRVINGHTK